MTSAPPPNPLWRGLNLREGELGPILLAFAYHLCLFISYAVMRPVREEMGVLVGKLEWLYTWTFVTVLIAQPLFALLVVRVRRSRLIPIVYGFLASNILLFYFGWQVPDEDLRRLFGAGFFVWLSAYNMFAISIFWSLMADVFRPDQGRRLFGILAAGASLGGALGALVARSLVLQIGKMNLLLIGFGFLLVAALLAFAMSRMAPDGSGEQGEKPVGGSIWTGLQHIFAHPLLRLVSGYIFLMTLVNTFLYFMQREIIKNASQSSDVRTQMFADMDLYTSILAGILQVLLAGRIIGWIGVGWTLAIFPLLAVGGLFSLGLAPSLMVLVVVQVLLRSSRYGTAKPAREYLFTMVSREDKYKTKNAIDTCIYRGGDVVNSWLYGSLQSLGIGLQGIAFFAVPIAAGFAGLGLLLGRGDPRG